MLKPRTEQDLLAWRQFEKDVCEIYALLGYEAEHDLRINGQQIDVIATHRLPGGILHRLIIDAKYSEKSKAGNDDIHSIVPAYQALKAMGQVDACVVVTTVGFTKDAKDSAKAAGVVLMTKDELVRSLFDFRPYLRSIQDDYTKQFGRKDCNWYIKTCGNLKDGALMELDDLADRWLGDPTRKPLAIFGGYGTGKSSFCLHFAHRLIRVPGAPIPIIFRLREYHRYQDFDALIRTVLDRDIGAQWPRFDLFWRMFREGHLLLFLDGLDEMVIRADGDALLGNMIEIDRYASASPNVILTTRPEHFTGQKEVKANFQPNSQVRSRLKTDFTIAEVKLWSMEQITEFVRRRLTAEADQLPHSIDYYVRQIQDQPGFHDVARRAVHLDLLVRMLPKMVAGEIPVTRLSLYQVYLDDEFERDKLKHRHLMRLKDAQKLRLLTAIVWHNYVLGRSGLDYQTAMEVVAAELKPPHADLEGTTREFLGRSFLERRGDEYFFAHKSTGEYLFARQAHRQLRLKRLSFLSGVRHFTGPICGMTFEHFGYTSAGLRAFFEALEIDGAITKGRQARAILFGAMALADYVAVKSNDGNRWGKEIQARANATAVLAEDAVTTYVSVDAIPDGKLHKIAQKWERTKEALVKSGWFTMD